MGRIATGRVCVGQTKFAHALHEELVDEQTCHGRRRDDSQANSKELQGVFF